MKQLLRMLIFASVIFSLACQGGRKVDNSNDVEIASSKKVLSPTEEIQDVIKQWAGAYNNDIQIKERKAAGDPILSLGADNMGWLQLTSHYVPINNPDLGEHLLYVEEYRDANPDSTYRQRIYKLHVDSTNTKRVTMCTFKDKEKFVGAYKDAKMLDNISPDEISPYPAFCDMIITTTEDGYEMKMKDKACAFGGKYYDYRVKLENGKYYCRDRIAMLETDSLVFTSMDYQWHELDRVY